jgi:hypothetical protein
MDCAEWRKWVEFDPAYIAEYKLNGFSYEIKMMQFPCLG